MSQNTQRTAQQPEVTVVVIRAMVKEAVVESCTKMLVKMRPDVETFSSERHGIALHEGNQNLVLLLTPIFFTGDLF